VASASTLGHLLRGGADHYVETISNLPAMQEWLAAAREEHDFVQEDELYRTTPDS